MIISHFFVLCSHFYYIPVDIIDMLSRNKLPRTSKYQSGFSLIELLVVISVASILLTVAIPSFQTFSQSSNVDSIHTKLYNSLVFARSEAINRNKIIKVCRRRNDSNQCALPANSDWSDGWLVYIDEAAQNASDVVISGTSAEVESKILKAITRLPNGTTIDREIDNPNPLRSNICFDGNGMLCSDLDRQTRFVIDSSTTPDDKYQRRTFVSVIGKINLESDKHQ